MAAVESAAADATFVTVSPGVDVHLHTYVRAGVTVAEAQNVVLFQHGLGEHGGRYCEMAERLFSRAPALDALLTYDIRGHGMTAKGIYCKVASVGELAADFDKVLDHWLAVCSPTARFVVAGHSLGGLAMAVIVSDAARAVNARADVRDRICGTILSAPALAVRVTGTLNKALAPLAHYVNKLPGAKRVTKSNDIPVTALTRDEDAQRAYSSDSLVHRLVSFGLAEDLLRAGSHVCRRARADAEQALVVNRVPLLLLYGAEDQVVDARGGEALAAAVRSTGLVTLVTVAAARHEVMNEVEPARGEFYDAVATFLARCWPAADG